MAAWTTNQDWDVPTKTELCGRVSDRYIPCAHERPCPIHEPKLPRLPALEPYPEPKVKA